MNWRTRDEFTIAGLLALFAAPFFIAGFAAVWIVRRFVRG